jgi:hypothetical protein
MKLWATTKGLQAWSDKKVGHVESQLSMAQEILHQLEIAQDSRPLIPDEVTLKNMLKKRSLMLSPLKRTIVRLQSRICWLKEGMPIPDFSTCMLDTRKERITLEG